MAASDSSFQCVATLGPASFSLVSSLAAAGATSFRLNTSHMNLQEVQAGLTSVRSACSLPVILDLQGAKMRLGQFPARPVEPSEAIVFAQAQKDAVPLAHPEIYAQVRPGETLSLDDDRLRFTVLSVSAAAQRIEAKAVSGGLLKPRKGINLVEHPVVLSDLSPFDQDVCRLGASAPEVAFAVSFVAGGEELEWVRRRAPGRRVIAKIERREAALSVQTLVRSADEIWICRGDLGAQLGLVGMASWVAGFDPRDYGCPVLMAGQVLEHLTDHATPTRSEVCHLHDLVARGYSGIVLSDETAIGSDPEHAVRVAAELTRAFRSSS